MPIAPVTLADLTTQTVDGTGAFDVLMAANKAHLEAEFAKGRIKGNEYSQVYLGSLQTVLNTALQFLLNKDKASLEAQLIEKQIELVNAQVLKEGAELLKVNAEVLLLGVEKLKADAELAILQQGLPKIAAEIAHLTQQTTNLAADALNIPKQGALIDAQTSNTLAQADIAAQEILVKQQEVLVKQQEVLVATAEVAIAQAKLVNLPKEGALLDAQAGKVTRETTNLVAEALNIPKIGAKLDNEILRVYAEKCKLEAEFDVLILTKDKVTGETALLSQKTATEKAQTLAIGVDPDSVIGKQKGLYQAQTDGFSRDAEQKAAKILVDTWAVRMTTTDTSTANVNNQLTDTDIGSVITKLKTGIAA